MQIKNGHLLPMSELKELLDIIKNVKNQYNINDFYIKSLEISKRLKTTAGQVTYYDNSGNTGDSYAKISLAYNNYVQFGFDSFKRTLLHELVHVIQCAKTGKMNHDRDFKRVCALIGGQMNESLAGIKYKSCATKDFCKK